MRKFLLILLLLTLPACGILWRRTSLRDECAHTETRLEDFSKTITSHYLAAGLPDGFDETTLFAILKAEHPDQKAVSFVREHYSVRVRRVMDRYYDLVLCTRGAEPHKLMEDFSCTTTYVDVHSCIEGDTSARCEFSAEATHYCK